jgi:hypothetical protein
METAMTRSVGSALLHRIERSLSAAFERRRFSTSRTPWRRAEAAVRDGFYIGLGDPFDDDRRRIRPEPDLRCRR